MTAPRPTLTQQEARTILGLSRPSLIDLERQGKLHTVRSEGGHRTYIRDEVVALARKRHVKVDRVAASIAVAVFEMFKDGYELPEIVIQTGQSPATIRDLFAEYTTPLRRETPEAASKRLAEEQRAFDERMRHLDDEIAKKRKRSSR